MFLFSSGTLLQEKKPRPKYCRICGAKLIPNTVGLGFDDQTGEPIKPTFNELACPYQLNREHGYLEYDYNERHRQRFGNDY